MRPPDDVAEGAPGKNTKILHRCDGIFQQVEQSKVLILNRASSFPRLRQQAADENAEHAGAGKKEARISCIRRDALDANPWGAKGYRRGKSQNHGSCSSGMCLRHYPS